MKYLINKFSNNLFCCLF